MPARYEPYYNFSVKVVEIRDAAGNIIQRPRQFWVSIYRDLETDECVGCLLGECETFVKGSPAHILDSITEQVVGVPSPVYGVVLFAPNRCRPVTVKDGDSLCSNSI